MGLKRILSLLTVTVLVGTSVVGCSSSNGGDSSGNASGRQGCSRYIPI